uniref:Phospholipase A2 domain-containing protein n=1 Tax=Meloidogyne floridensis TaxID=298350 RepID=A0A915P983_9BILA
MLKTIEEKMDIKSFWVGFSVKGIRLEEALDFAGFVVLEKDLSFKSDGTKMRNVHIKHHQDDTCKEVKQPQRLPRLQRQRPQLRNLDSPISTLILFRCCNLHHQCLNELLKECPSIPPAKHFVDIDTTKYEIDSGLFETRNVIKCKAQDPCQKQLCECDRSAAECWTQTSAPEAGPLCFACYFDEGRKLAKDPISTFVSLRKIFLEETLKVKNATNMIKNGEVAANSEYVNSTILSAVFVVRNGHSRILDAEEGYAQIMAQTIGFLNPDFNNTETANNNGKELSDYSAEAAYNFTLARVTLLEFEKEKFATYELGELAFKTIEELEEVISENL